MQLTIIPINMRKLLRNIFLEFLGSFKKPSKGIHILNLHYVTKNKISDSDFQVFENFIIKLQKLGTIITLPEAINTLSNNNVDFYDTKFVLTFDDGFEECYKIIVPILNKYNLKATFFINANYIQSCTTYQNNFNKRIKIVTKKPMSWEQLLEIHNNGHTIGSHTLDHLNMNNLNSEQLVYQIHKNKEILEYRLKFKCEHFAWPYGQMNDFPEKALLETEKHHKYIYSGTNYKKYYSYNKRIINRRHIEPFWPISHLKYFLSYNKI